MFLVFLLVLKIYNKAYKLRKYIFELVRAYLKNYLDLLFFTFGQNYIISMIQKMQITPLKLNTTCFLSVASVSLDSR